jgi:hypothetical protein
MNFYQKNNLLMANIFSSKSSTELGPADIRIKEVLIAAGPYKPSGFYLSHPLIFKSVFGQFPKYKYQQHGKRARETVSIVTSYRSDNDISSLLGRFTSLIFPSIADMRTVKNIKRKRAGSVIAFRMRYKFGVNFPDCDDFIMDEMHDTKRGVFLPMSITIKFSNSLSHLVLEDICRSLRLPVSLYR